MPNGDYRGFKKQGDPLKISALAHNRWQRAATWVEGQQQKQSAEQRETLPEGMCWIQNSSGSLVSRFGILGISGTFFMTTTSSALDAFQGVPVLTGVTPTTASHTGKFAIAYEPIANGAFGRAFVFGICAVQIYINSSTDGFAEVKDSDATQLNSGAQGSVQIIPGSFSGTGTQWAMIRFGVPAPSLSLIPVNVSQFNGSNGTGTTAPTYGYNVTTIAGSTVGGSAGAVFLPVWQRPKGAVTPATHGNGYYDSNVTFHLYQVDETPSTTVCTSGG